MRIKLKNILFSVANIGTVLATARVWRPDAQSISYDITTQILEVTIPVDPRIATLANIGEVTEVIYE